MLTGIKYYDNIGYRYCSTKNNTSFVIIEYLKYKQYLFKEHEKIIENIRIHGLFSINYCCINTTVIKNYTKFYQFST